MIKKVLLGFAAFIVVAGFATWYYIISNPDLRFVTNLFLMQPLPENTNAIVQQVLESELPEFVTGETGFANSNGVKIWFEVIDPTDEPKGTVVLVMGAQASALDWPEHFIKPLIAEHYRVVRFDHRGTGRSDWIENWSVDNAYDLSELADDAIAVLDTLGVRRAHVIGISMGGMVGQEIAIRYSERIASLVSISSSGFLEIPENAEPPPFEALFEMNFPGDRSEGEEKQVKMAIAFYQMLRGKGEYALDVRAIAQRELYRLRRGLVSDPNLHTQQNAAMAISGSRLELLGDVTVPTLVVHGSDDWLIPLKDAERYAAVIPNVTTLWVDGMGHDLPKAYMGQVSEAILSHLDRVGIR